MSKYFSNGMRCIYLDQNASSNICASAPEGRWDEISHLMKEGVRRKRLLIPISIEHCLETSKRIREEALHHDNELRKLSFGWSVYPEPIISANLLARKIRNIKVGKTVFLRKSRSLPLAAPGVADDFLELRSIYKTTVSDAVGGVNLIRDHTRGGTRSSAKGRDSLVSVIKQRHAQYVIDRLELLHSSGTFKPRLIELGGFEIPFWADSLCHILTTSHRLSRAEAKKGARILEAEGIDAIPTISIRATLEAMMAITDKRETDNDHLDISRASCALPLSDMVILDRGKAAHVREIKLDQKYEAVVFAARNDELNGIVEYLESAVYG